jgi:hypothetical protein
VNLRFDHHWKTKLFDRGRHSLRIVDDNAPRHSDVVPGEKTFSLILVDFH